MKRFTLPALGALVTVLLASAFGCELIAQPDRSQIPDSEVTGGGGGQSATSSSSSSSGGTGGAGGSTSSSAGGGGGGTPCSGPADCPEPQNQCVDLTCDMGVCGTKPKDAGTPTASQTLKDCKHTECDGAGMAVDIKDDTDLPDDSNLCTDDICTAGVPSNPPKPAETACGVNLKCDGAGQCVGCITKADCGQDTACQAKTCMAGVCGVNNQQQGTMAGAQQAGNCKVNQCDGNGAIETVDDNADVPVDNKACTKDTCVNGAASNPAEAAGTACAEGGGTKCDGAGACVKCIAPTDCPATGNECVARTCSAGMCGTMNVALGTLLAAQTGGDCKKAVCNGNGGTTSQNDDADASNDNNACTDDSCSGGVPTHVNKADGDSCGGTLTCLSGACTGCSMPSDCPGANDECKTRTCAVGVCGFNFTPDETPVAMQTAGDCKKKQCDGAGNTESVDDNADVPADDAQECTTEACVAGVPSHTAKPTDTACTQGGGAFCSAAGTCVECNVLTQCAGQDTDCQARTCTNNVCGTAFQPAGTMTSAATQTTGDCQVKQCDGAGNIVSAESNGDVPADDGFECTSAVCSSGVPAQTPKPVNTTCTQGGGAFCNGGAACVQCNMVSQCPGQDTDCQTRACTANACGFSFTAAGTATSTQMTGDCKENQCDGAGNVVSANKDADLPDDGKECTSEACTAGVVSHPNKPASTMCSEGGGVVCDGNGSCVTAGCFDAVKNGDETDVDCGGPMCAKCADGLVCSVASDCVNSVCIGGTCAAASCTDAVKNGDESGVDCGGATCPSCAVGETCSGDVDCASGACAIGVCVECNTAMQCPGTDTECHIRTCAGNACGVSNTAAGTATSSQTVGDCKKNQCDGAGSIASVADNADLPVDGDQCTSDVCTAGVPSNPAAAQDTACNQAGGSFCNAAGACVQCNAAAQCPGTDTECHNRTCIGNTCGVNNVAAGTATSSQTAGDCQKNQCDGAGSIASVADNADLPTDTNQCTDDVCTAGVPSNPAKAQGTACNQAGGTVCDGTGMCVMAPTVASTTPSDGAMAVASTTVAVMFTTAMNPATLTGQTMAGACSGSIQVSIDNFASCIAFSSASAVMSGGNTTATFTAAPGLLVNRGYKIRVTTAAKGASGIPIGAQFTSPTGFQTTSPNLCEGSLVISQVYGAGGNSGATLRNDFVVLRNRGTMPISLSGKSLQYTSATGTGTWNSVVVLTGTVAPGGNFLVQLASGGAVGAVLPPADQSSGAINMAAADGKIALINGTSSISGMCPPVATTIDFVGFGAANCKEGAAATGALSTTTMAVRVQSGCGDVNNNGADFIVAPAAAPPNSASAPSACACTVENESNAALEADYCNVQFPLTLNVAAGASTGIVYGQIFEMAVTEAAGANANVRAQLGYGPATANPEYEASWQWFNATYNVQSGNNDEYQASFTAPAQGSYRYVYRMSLDNGVSWTYCDQNAGDGGAGSNGGLTFEFSNEPTLTVP